MKLLSQFTTRFSRYMPSKDVILFLMLLLGSHFLWKIVMNEDIQGDRIAFLGIDLSSSFKVLSLFYAKLATTILQLCGDDVRLDHGTRLLFGNGIGVVIIWGCTAVKQVYMFATIVIFSRGPWKPKLWFVPVFSFLLLIFNTIRITVIAHFTGMNPAIFDSLHELFRLLFYGIIFVMWVLWEERFHLTTISSYSIKKSV